MPGHLAHINYIVITCPLPPGDSDCCEMLAVWPTAYLLMNTVSTLWEPSRGCDVSQAVHRVERRKTNPYISFLLSFVEPTRRVRVSTIAYQEQGRIGTTSEYDTPLSSSRHSPRASHIHDRKLQEILENQKQKIDDEWCSALYLKPCMWRPLRGRRKAKDRPGLATTHPTHMTSNNRSTPGAARKKGHPNELPNIHRPSSCDPAVET
ncbi:hypothetical protein J6590_006047 [Homalodisca vitripennis]|nr:hypothetical protein J6590_006047 [Homalodisca vitripennis]